ncbi:MAG: glycosyltransferase family 2 protein [Pseudomonadota bacterium]
MQASQPTFSEYADIRFTTGLSIIIPTYKEVENIPHILARLDLVRQTYGLLLEVLFVDDSSDDGSVEAVMAAGHDWARIIVRTENRGLSPSVIDGFAAAQYPILICMDCDLSHPPEQIPQMILGLNAGQQMMIGSRYVPGGSTDDDWGFLRWLASAAATVMARPLTPVSDPMSGFFAIRKADFDAAKDLNPIGYKIMLELIVKCRFENVGEVPIHFSDRVRGTSKLTVSEQLKYIQHLRRLYLYRFANAMHLAQFLVVGALGVVVNLCVLTLLLFLGLPEAICLAGGIVVSVGSNFLLNRRLTFSYARHRPVGHQFVGFLGASAVGAGVSFMVSLVLRTQVLGAASYGLHLAALGGIACGMIFNYLGSRFLVFRKTYVRPRESIAARAKALFK